MVLRGLPPFMRLKVRSAGSSRRLSIQTTRINVLLKAGQSSSMVTRPHASFDHSAHPLFTCAAQRFVTEMVRVVTTQACKTLSRSKAVSAPFAYNCGTCLATQPSGILRPGSAKNNVRNTSIVMQMSCSVGVSSSSLSCSSRDCSELRILWKLDTSKSVFDLTFSFISMARYCMSRKALTSLESQCKGDLYNSSVALGCG